MAVTPRLDLKQTQSLLMTPELRQAISLLQVSNLELSQLIEKELETNPLLEREDDRMSAAEEVPGSAIDSAADDTPPNENDFASDNHDYDNDSDDFGSDREGYDEPAQYDWQDYASAKSRRDDDDFDYFEQKLAGADSLYQSLEKQISLAFPKPRERSIAFILSRQLDEAGYFRGNLTEISQKLNLPEPEISHILNQMKEFEPSGIFAQDLTECLQIQLRDIGRLDSLAQKVLDNLSLIGEGKIKELKKICDINDEDFASVLADIRSLNPKPAAAFVHDVTSYVIPDVFVRRHNDGSYRVELNSLSLPRILINRSYYTEIQNNTPDKKAAQYLKQQLSSAGFLVKALHQRAETILKVSSEIVKNQLDFFEKGIDYLKPMQLKDIAEAAEIHESTVSRAAANKYMHTPRGIFELKYFFSAAAGSYVGDDNTSTITIKHRIKQLISEETKVLSDDKIAAILGQSGIKIARRTIAKYREALGIPSSAERKRSKKSLV